MPDVTQPARTYLLCSGLFLLVTGLVGFALDTSVPTTSADVAASHGHIFGSWRPMAGTTWRPWASAFPRC